MAGNVIHVQLEYGEAIDNRKGVLSSQINAIKLLQHIKNYHELRKKELDKKLEITKKLTSINANINKMNKLLPVLKIPKILKKEEEETEETSEKKIVKKTIVAHPLEKELQNIKKELAELESKT